MLLQTSYVAATLFLLLLCLQFVFPKRKFDSAVYIARLHNGLLFVVNLLIFKFLVPLSLIAVAIWSSNQQLGLFNQFAGDSWWQVLVSLILLDFAIYWQHVASHKWNWLWRIHRVHHFDLEMDITTAVRFHPLELFLSLLYKALVILLLGAPVLAVVIFEFLLLAGAMFSHSNLYLPIRAERWLRYVLVTPDMHRIHHSIYQKEHDTNYGFFLPWWDFWFNSYTAEPKDGQQTMKIGLKQNREPEFCGRVISLLKIPFRTTIKKVK